MNILETHSIEHILLAASTLVLLSIFSSKVSTRFGIPTLALFLGIGMLAGSESFGGIYFDNALAAKSLGVIALVLILFVGGLDTSWETIRQVALKGISLSTLGVLTTTGLVGVFTSWILRISLLEGMLLGAVVSATDAAAVFSVLKSKKTSLKGQLQPLLEFESGSNDPMAVFLTLAIIRLLTGPVLPWWDLGLWFLHEMILGALIGTAAAEIIPRIINKINLEFEGLYAVFTLALVLLVYSLTSSLGGNGFLAVYLAGILMSRKRFLLKKNLLQFHEGIAWLMQIVMFLVLGLLVFPSRLMAVWAVGLLIAVFLIFVARPVSVFISLLFTKMKVNEKLFISWVGLRGAAPIILATFPLLAGLKNAEMIFNVVFFITLTSVIFQGSSVALLAKWLKVEGPPDQGRRPFPIGFEQTSGVDANLTELIIPYNSLWAGKAIYELNLPAESLIVLIGRDDKFIVASGKTVLESGDIVLTLAKEENLKTIQALLSQHKEK